MNEDERNEIARVIREVAKKRADMPLTISIGDWIATQNTALFRRVIK